ncbi:hypothetical protein [Methylobacterium sp. J-067]|uniref:hypothetical protein n=1 Tax=Methylobacterium sp. J-067 TaxID=2836648 RepID=UPI001FB9533A|nr:hypothetical protein [Methylobacterium sp. J-067]MCJ2024711.1 hypothetical protein [Methylobacterium sp. J-067]
MKSVITSEEAEEVQRLWREYGEAALEAAAALRDDGTDPDFKGKRRQRHLVADERAGRAIARIREIYEAP